MILTASFLICKALGATWSWWYIIVTILADYTFREDITFTLKVKK